MLKRALILSSFVAASFAPLSSVYAANTSAISGCSGAACASAVQTAQSSIATGLSAAESDAEIQSVLDAVADRVAALADAGDFDGVTALAEAAKSVANGLSSQAQIDAALSALNGIETAAAARDAGQVTASVGGVRGSSGSSGAGGDGSKGGDNNGSGGGRPNGGVSVSP